MYYKLSDRLALDTGATTETLEFSVPVDMEEADAVEADVVVYNRESGGTLSAQVQQSNDLQNWVDVGTAIVATDPGYYPTSTPITDIGMAYVRLKYTFGDSTNQRIVLSSGVSPLAE